MDPRRRNYHRRASNRDLYHQPQHQGGEVMRDYLADFLFEQSPEKLGGVYPGNPQNPQKPPSFSQSPPFEGFEGASPNTPTENFGTATDENPEMHDSALFDVITTFYDGRRLVIPQQSTPPGWQSPF